MFFFKKQPKPEENVAKKSIKHMDAVVTGVILGSIVWSIYGVSKLKKRQEDAAVEATHMVAPETPIKRKGFFQRLFWR